MTPRRIRSFALAAVFLMQAMAWASPAFAAA
jgi:hypothetical protein